MSEKQPLAMSFKNSDCPRNSEINASAGCIALSQTGHAERKDDHSGLAIFPAE